MYGEFDLGGHFASVDGLQTFGPAVNGLTGPSRFVAPTDLDPHRPTTLFTATKSAVYRSVDGASSWNSVLNVWDVVSISVSPVTPLRIWALERGTGVVHLSTDGGDSWTGHMATPFAGIGGTKILADPRDSMAAFCTFLHYPSGAPLIVRTHDGGSTWQDVSGDLGEQAVNSIAVDPRQPNDWYIGTDVGIWVTQDGGTHWRPYGLGLPNALVLDVEIQESVGQLYAATHGRGLWRTETLNDLAARELTKTSVLLEIVSRNPSPDQFSIRFGARGGLPARLDVFSLQGRRVASVTQAPADGTARVTSWRPVGLASGIYFLVVRSGSDHVTRKVVLIR
jgi:hypothetical protein